MRNPAGQWASRAFDTGCPHRRGGFGPALARCPLTAQFGVRRHKIWSRQVVLECSSLYNAGSSRAVSNTIALPDDKFNGKNLKPNSEMKLLTHQLNQPNNHRNSSARR